MTRDEYQEVFDRVATHMLLQKKKSVSEEMIRDKWGHQKLASSCMYRGDDGLKCAVGCLIKDELYNECIEHQGVDDADVIDALTESGIVCSDYMLKLLVTLQGIHDDSDPKHWENALGEVAEGWGLTLPSVSKAVPLS